jgi:hypothetical protein
MPAEFSFVLIFFAVFKKFWMQKEFDSIDHEGYILLQEGNGAWKKVYAIFSGPFLFGFHSKSPTERCIKTIDLRAFSIESQGERDLNPFAYISFTEYYATKSFTISFDKTDAKIRKVITSAVALKGYPRYPKRMSAFRFVVIGESMPSTATKIFLPYTQVQIIGWPLIK